MPDLNHLFGGDLTLLNGDLQTVSGTNQVTQRLYRRLLTNPGAYPGHADYGGGLGAFVGSPASADRIRAIVLQQCLLEPDVSQSPVPTVTVSAAPGGLTSVQILYTNAASGETDTLTIPLI